MRLLLAIGCAGFFGAVARYLMGQWVVRILPPTYPFATLSVNLIGSLLLGVVFVLGTERAVLDPTLRTALAVGFLGAFTTFSTFSLETVHLLREGSTLLAAVNMGSNLLVCIGAAWAGMSLARLL